MISSGNKITKITLKKIYFDKLNLYIINYFNLYTFYAYTQYTKYKWVKLNKTFKIIRIQ